MYSILSYLIQFNVLGWILVGNNDPIFLAMKPRQCTIYRNPLSAHKWTIENFLWTEEKQTSSSLNHGVDYFFDLSAVRAYLEKHNQHRNEDVFDVDAQPAVAPTAAVHTGDRDMAGSGKGHSNIVIVESDNYTEYIDDSDDECLDNLSLDRVNPTPAYVDISLSNTLRTNAFDSDAFDSNPFDKSIRSGVCVTSTSSSTSTSALPCLTSLHISTEGCSAWARTMALGLQTLDLTLPDSSSSSSEAQQENSVEVVEVMDVLEMSDEEWRLKTFGFAESPKAAKEEGNKGGEGGNEGGSEGRSEGSSVESNGANEKEDVHRLDQQKDVLTPSRDAGSDRVTIDLNLIADTDIDVAVELAAEAEGDVDGDGDVEVIGVQAISNQSSTVKDASSSNSSSTVKKSNKYSSGSAVKSKSNSSKSSSKSSAVKGTSSSAIKASNSSSTSTRYTDPSPEEQERVRAQEQSDLASRRQAKRLSRGYVTLY